MRQINLEQFWADDETAHRENCFSKEARQVALGIRMSGEPDSRHSIPPSRWRR